MATYSLSQRTSNTLIATPIWELRASASVPAMVYEIAIVQQSSLLNFMCLGRPPIRGAGPANVTFLADDGDGAAANTTGAITWSTAAPTFPVNFIRRYAAGGSVGNTVIWTFPRGLLVPVNTSLAIYSFNSGNLYDIWCGIDE